MCKYVCKYVCQCLCVSVCVFALQIAGYILYNLMHEMPFLPVSGRKLSEIIALPCTVTTADLMNKHVNRMALAIHRAREICYMDIAQATKQCKLHSIQFY